MGSGVPKALHTSGSLGTRNTSEPPQLPRIYTSNFAKYVYREYLYMETMQHPELSCRGGNVRDPPEPLGSGHNKHSEPFRATRSRPRTTHDGKD